MLHSRGAFRWDRARAIASDTLGSLLLLAVACSTAACARDPELARAQHEEKARNFTAAGKHAEAVIELRNAVQATVATPHRSWSARPTCSRREWTFN
jgi:hypothetical protein